MPCKSIEDKIKQKQKKNGPFAYLLFSNPDPVLSSLRQLFELRFWVFRLSGSPLSAPLLPLDMRFGFRSRRVSTSSMRSVNIDRVSEPSASRDLPNRMLESALALKWSFSGPFSGARFAYWPPCVGVLCVVPSHFESLDEFALNVVDVSVVMVELV